MIANWFYDVGDSWWQILHCSCCRVGDPHSTDFPPPFLFFSLLLYDFFFISSPLKPCGYCICLIMMRHVPFSPNLYTTWHILRNDLRDLRKWRKMFFPSAGWRSWGWVYKNQYKNEYQMVMAYGYCTCLIMMQHVSFSPNLYTTARFSPNLYTTAWQFYEMIPVTFKREGHANWPARLQVELYNGNWKIINKHCISWNMLKIYLNLTKDILK
jgi:hypothetical protein